MPKKTIQDRNEELLRQERENVRLTAIQADMRELSDKVKTEERDFTDDEKARWERMKGEFDRIVADQERSKEIERMDEYVGRQREIHEAFQDAGGESPELRFENFGEFVREVAAVSGFGRPTEKRDILIQTGSTGGNLVPTQFLDSILQVDPARSIVRPRAQVIPPGERPDATLEIPYFDMSDEYGDIEPETRAEDGTMSENDPTFGLLSLTPKEKSSYVEVSKKSLENITAISSFLERRFRLSKEAKEDYLFLRGTGTGEPKGVLNAAARILVSRDTSANVKFADVTSMLASMLDFTGAAWVINQEALPKIVALADSNGNAVYIAGDASKGIPPTLFGFPVLWSSRNPGLGTAGDVMFANLSYYIIKDGSGPAIEMFDVQPKTRLVTFTSTWNTDGDLWLASAITREDGNDYSPVIVLN